MIILQGLQSVIGKSTVNFFKTPALLPKKLYICTRQTKRI